MMSQVDAQELADTLLSRSLDAGSIVIFVGAGASRSVGVPSWADLVERLTNDQIERLKSAHDPDMDLTALAPFPDLIKATNAVPGPLHKAIATLRPQAVVTTNYDNLIERALRDDGAPPVVVTVGGAGDRHGSGVPLVFKLHGTVDRPQTLALSPGDALTSRESLAADRRLRSLLSTSLVLLIGYSTDSAELDALYEELGIIAQKRSWFLLSASDDPIGEALWRRRGVETVHVGGGDVPEVLRLLAKSRTASALVNTERDSLRVFVSARDAKAADQIADLLRSLGLRPFELSESAVHGRPLFERLNEAAHTSVAAIVVLENESESSRERSARENVLFELGFLAGVLGTDRVLVVVPPGTAVPSDLAGVRYGLFDGGSVEPLIQQWVKAMGLPVTA